MANFDTGIIKCSLFNSTFKTCSLNDKICVCPAVVIENNCSHSARKEGGGAAKENPGGNRRKLAFDGDAHRYFLDGEELPSVTHLIRFLDADVDKSRPWLRDEAAERGTIVHTLCTMLDYGEDISEETPAYLQGYITGYVNFLRDHEVQWELIERCDWAEIDGTRYAGTLDRYGYLDGVPTVVDIKTGSSGSKHRHAAQLTAYSRFPCVSKRPNLAVLYLHRDGTYKLTPLAKDEPLLKACCLMQSRIGGKSKK